MASSGHTPSETSVTRGLAELGADIGEGWVTARRIALRLGIPTDNVRCELRVLEGRQRAQSRTGYFGQTEWQLDDGGRE